jgi:hypothetical protein
VKIQRPRPLVLHVKLSAYEMATLMAAVRWVVEGREGELTEEALGQLQQVLGSYDAEMERLKG